ncbi:MAG: hypothetical protein M1434_06905 [Chloroflexi bacterium]|nr:hypothetical protein [Chloroflexota bacterium]MCL5274460.1 hypothetical protein [Chloroflexota bacterium]
MNGKPGFCTQEHIDYLGEMMDTIGAERPLWNEYLLKRFPDLTPAQADEIVYYCLMTYVDTHPAQPTHDNITESADVEVTAHSMLKKLFLD